MVLAAQRKKVGEVGRSPVAPPVQVVRFGVVERDVAAGDSAGGVDGAKGASLGAVGEAGGAAEVQLAVGVDHSTVSNDDRAYVGVSAEVLGCVSRGW